MNLAETLVPFGFTALESEVYVFLLKESPATGYRIAQGINKPAANTYKAIQSLQSKGAILVEEGPSRMCRAVPLEELMNRLEKDFSKRRQDAVKSLKGLGSPGEDERIYRLQSREQILNRVREMLKSATSVALAKIPMSAIVDIQEDLTAASQRGVTVSLLGTEAFSSGVIESVVAPEIVPGAISIAIDGAQCLTGILSDSGADAYWSRSPLLTKGLHAGLSAEIALANVATLLAADEKRSRISRAIENRKPLP